MARPGSEVAVLGGGLLGIEAARGLAGRGMRVTVLHPVGHLMERQLDPGAGAVLAGSLAGLGVDVRLGVSADSWHPGHGVLLDDGTTVPAQAVVVSAGVRPETGLAEAAGLKVDRGVLVDDRLCTSDPRVYAIGDCARHAAGGAGLVQPGWEQAAVLADVLSCADPWARYRGTPSITRLKARGVDLAALGDVHAQDGEVLSFADSARGRYAKLVLADDRVRGAILLGLPDAAATIVQLYDRGAPAPADRLALLFGRALPDEVVRAESPAQMPDKSIVCRCNTVTKKALTVAWRSGAQDVPALGRATRAGTGCGSCGDVVQGICEWLAATETADAGGAAEREGAA
jgi:assimilatory nitrate reductase electron transfer subunit